MIIGISGKARSGKDTVAEYLRDKYGYTIVKFSTPLYEIATYIQNVLGEETNKDPKLLQFLGQGLKSIYGTDIWCKLLLSNLSEDQYTVIADIRHKIEMEYLEQGGVPVLRIERPTRVIDRDPNHISEIDLDDYPFKYVIINDGSIDELYVKIDEIVKNIYIKF
jgi:dephospho-CoA kinase